MTRLIAVASGKGGVGKTTTAVNVGTALAAFNKNVIIVDANLTTPNVGLHLGIHSPLVTLNDVIDGQASLVDAIHLHESGLRVIPAGLSVRHLKSARPERIWDIVLDLFGSADVVLFDTPAGLEKGATSVLDAGEEVLIITNPELPAVTDALRTIRIAQHTGAEPIGVVVNKVRREIGEMSRDEIENMLDVPVVAAIPHDAEVRRSIRLNGPVCVRKPSSPAARAYKQLAADLIGLDFELQAEGRPVVRVLKKLFGMPLHSEY